ncbi:MAG: FtsH protease activity modulator HflK [Rhodospirillaceae bacterium]
MSWSNQGGGGGGPWGGGGGNGGGNGGSPWGQRPGGGGTPPDLEDVIRKGQDRVKRMIPGGFGSGKGLIAILLIAIVGWGLTGFFRVLPNQEGVVLRFGELNRTTGPGLHYHLPSPIETVLTPDVTRENRIEVGHRLIGARNARSSSKQDVPEESLMITGDENIVDIDFIVFWRINDASAFLFNLQNPEETVKMAAESVMRAIVGQTPIQQALTDGREAIEEQTRNELQGLVDEYKAGIDIRQVQLLDVDPPSQVIDAFNEVARAIQDKETVQNQAEAYRNDVVPRARGEAAQMMKEAEAYRAEVVNRATGDANRFNSVYQAYSVSKDVTTQRIYLETLEEVFSKVNKIVIDKNAGGSGVVPYLPLPEVQNRAKTGDSQ